MQQPTRFLPSFKKGNKPRPSAKGSRKLRFGTWPRNRLLQKEEDSAGLDELVVRQKLFPSDLSTKEKGKKNRRIILGRC
jgi:hypothetical protein